MKTIHRTILKNIKIIVDDFNPHIRVLCTCPHGLSTYFPKPDAYYVPVIYHYRICSCGSFILHDTVHLAYNAHNLIKSHQKN